MNLCGTGAEKILLRAVPSGCPEGAGQRLALAAWDVDDEAIQSVLDLDLAAEAALGADIEGEVEHVFFHHRWAADRLGPGVVDIDMAGGAGAGASAFRDNAGDAIHNGSFHHGGAELAFGFDAFAVLLDESNLGHRVSELLCATDIGHGQRFRKATAYRRLVFGGLAHRAIWRPVTAVALPEFSVRDFPKPLLDNRFIVATLINEGTRHNIGSVC